MYLSYQLLLPWNLNYNRCSKLLNPHNFDFKKCGEKCLILSSLWVVGSYLLLYLQELDLVYTGPLVFGVKSELQLPVYTTATALGIWAMAAAYTTAHGNAGIPDPLSRARDQTHFLMDTSWVHYCWATMGTPAPLIFISVLIYARSRRVCKGNSVTLIFQNLQSASQDQ